MQREFSHGWGLLAPPLRRPVEKERLFKNQCPIFGGGDLQGWSIIRVKDDEKKEAGHDYG